MNINTGENLGSSVARIVLLANQLQKDSASGKEPETVYQLANLIRLEVDQIRLLSLDMMKK